MLTRLILVAGLLSGCSIPSSVVRPAVSGQELSLRTGTDYCSDVEYEARRLSNLQTFLSYTMAGLAVGSAVTGTVLLGLEDEDKKERRVAGSVALLATSTVLGYIALAQADRAKAAAELSKQANLALTLPEEGNERVNACLTATAAWAGSKGDAAALVQKILDEARVDEQEARKGKAEAETAKVAAEAERDALRTSTLTPTTTN